MSRKVRHTPFPLAAASAAVGGPDGSQKQAVSEPKPIPPLQWWRRLPAEAFTAGHVKTLRKAMSGIGMIGEPRWPDAVLGNPAAAIGVALKMMRHRYTPMPIIDLTASTLLVPAMTGDHRAIATLASLIRRHADPADRMAVENSWYWRQRTHLIERSMTAMTGTR